MPLVMSVVGGMIGAVLLAAFTPYFAGFALSFGPAEYCMFSAFALTIIASPGEGAFTKGAISGLPGMVIATVGLDPVDGYPRSTFGAADLNAGLDSIPVPIGLVRGGRGAPALREPPGPSRGRAPRSRPELQAGAAHAG